MARAFTCYVAKTDSTSWCGLRQGLLRSDCNPRSRTDYFSVAFTIFTLPAMIAFYVMGFRVLLWALRPALLFVMPRLQGRAFFDHTVHQRTNALSFDVRTPLASWQALPVSKNSNVFKLAICCRLPLG